jgi:hypothetical protein
MRQGSNVDVLSLQEAMRRQRAQSSASTSKATSSSVRSESPSLISNRTIIRKESKHERNLSAPFTIGAAVVGLAYSAGIAAIQSGGPSGVWSESRRLPTPDPRRYSIVPNGISNDHDSDSINSYDSMYGIENESPIASDVSDGEFSSSDVDPAEDLTDSELCADKPFLFCSADPAELRKQTRRPVCGSTTCSTDHKKVSKTLTLSEKQKQFALGKRSSLY